MVIYTLHAYDCMVVTLLLCLPSSPRIFPLRSMTEDPPDGISASLEDDSDLYVSKF